MSKYQVLTNTSVLELIIHIAIKLKVKYLLYKSEKLCLEIIKEYPAIKERYKWAIKFLNVTYYQES